MQKAKQKGAMHTQGKSSPAKAASKKSTPKKRPSDYLKAVCRIIVPILTAALLILDAMGIYIFSTERLTVLGIGLLVILLPFFSEITLKGISMKRKDPNDKG